MPVSLRGLVRAFFEKREPFLLQKNIKNYTHFD
nr:MAG TPA: hypothetical protein [Caudoviricetes sp.]